MTSPLSEMFAGVGRRLIYYGGHSVVSGHSTTGNFFSFITALFMLYEPVKRLSRINNVVQQGLAAGVRLRGDRHAAGGARSGGRGHVAPIRKEIALRSRRFRYAPRGGNGLEGDRLPRPRRDEWSPSSVQRAGKTTAVST